MCEGGREGEREEREREREREGERETEASRSTWQAVLHFASTKMDSENNESGRGLFFNL